LKTGGCNKEGVTKKFGKAGRRECEISGNNFPSQILNEKWENMKKGRKKM